MTDQQAGSAAEVDVSVIVLAYNHGPFIAECLDGILAQDFAGTIEILVGEDKSTDDTMTVVTRYKSRHPDLIRVITDVANVGMHENNRRLIRAARGRFVAYCEGDDYWHRSDKLSLQVSLLDAHPEVAGVHSDVDHLWISDSRQHSQTSYWQASQQHIPNPLRHADIVATNLVQTCTVVLRHAAISSYPESNLARSMYPMEDWPMFLHALETGPLVFLPKSLATYRHVPGSATRGGPTSLVAFVRGERRLIEDAAAGRVDCHVERIVGLTRTRWTLIHLGILTARGDVVTEAVTWGRTANVPENGWVRLLALTVKVPGAPALLRAALRAAQWTGFRESPGRG